MFVQYGPQNGQKGLIVRHHDKPALLILHEIYNGGFILFLFHFQCNIVGHGNLPAGT